MNVPVFQELTTEELRDLLVRVQRRTYRPDETIFREGDPPTFIYYVLSGEVGLSLTSEDRRVSLGKLQEGDLLGVLAIFDDGPQFYSATALTSTTLMAVPKQDIVTLLRRHPDTLFAMTGIMTRQIRTAALMIADMQFLDLPVRLAKRILELAGDGNPAAGSAAESMTVRITQEDLSELTGATRGGVNRALKRLETMGMVRTGRGRLVILAPDRLRQLAQEGPLPMVFTLTNL